MHSRDVILLVLLHIIGKKRTFKQGQSWDISAELFQKLPEITCPMYVPSTKNDQEY